MAIYVSLIDGMTNATDDDLSGFQTDFLIREGYTDLPQYTTPLAVTASGTPDKNSNVAPGVVYIPNSTSSPTQYYRIVNDATVTTLHSDTTSNPRIDAVVLFLDLSVSSDADGSNVASIQIIEGSEAGSPTAPSDADITTELGASTWTRLADIDIDNPFTSITSGDITDQRQETGISGDKIIWPSGDKISTYTDWQTWAPTFDANGSMTYTSVTTNYAQYVRIGNTVILQLRSTGTIGGTPSTALEFTLPISAASATAGVIVGGCQGLDGGVVGAVFENTDADTIQVRRYDGANWSSGSGRQIRIQLTYQV